VVVLDEVVVYAELSQHASAVRLDEEPSLVAVDRRFDQSRARELGWKSPHERAI
jgi:hypothetical protein